MKRVISVLFLVLLFLACQSAQARYYFVWNGLEDPNDAVTAYVGDIVTLEVASSNTTPPGPDAFYGAGGCIVDDVWGGRSSFVSAEVTSAAGSGASVGVVNQEGYTGLGITVPNPSSSGTWVTSQLLLTAPGFFQLRIGYYEPDTYAWVSYSTSTITVKVLPNPGAGTPPALVAWWMAENVLVEDGDKVSVLYDQSGNGYDAHDPDYYEATDPNDFRPTLIEGALNGYNAIQFDGAQCLQYSPPVDANDANWQDAQNYTWFLVANDLWAPADFVVYPEARDEYVFSTVYQYWDDEDPSDYSTTTAWGNYWQYYNYVGYPVALYSTIAPWSASLLIRPSEYTQLWNVDVAGAQSGWTILTGFWSGPGGVTLQGDFDGWYSKAKQNVGYGGDTQTASSLSQHIGTFLGAMNRSNLTGPQEETGFWSGQLAEVRIYRGAMSTGEIMETIDKLRCKYGLKADRFDLFAYLAANWLSTEPVGGDLNFDNFVDFVDYAVWTWDSCASE